MTPLIELHANYLVAAVNGGTPATRRIDNWLAQGATLQMSSIAWSEYLCGPLNESDKNLARTFLRSIEPFTAEDAELASELFDTTGRRSRSQVDCMIAAHAIRRGAELATLNPCDFQRFPRLRLVTEL